MKKINFITSNKGKINSLKEGFDNLGIKVIIEGQDLNIIEPQADSVKDVSLIKAKKAFEILKEPVLVEDGGFEVEALNGFPGVYTKFMLTTIGADGLLDLMRGKENRKAKFVSCTTYIDENGEVFQFGRTGGEGVITHEKSTNPSDVAWSDIWYIFYIDELGKTLSDCSKEEVKNWYASDNQKFSLAKFTEWFAEENK